MIYSIKDKLLKETFKSSDVNLSDDLITKIEDTVAYSMSVDASQNKIDVIKRCKIAICAEYATASLLDGFVVNNEINFEDPYSYAYDVIAGVQHHCGRVEVKTAQSNNDWITVNIDKKNESSSINLYHFLEYDVSDMIVIYQYSNSIYTTKYVGDRNDIKKHIKKSNYSGWYLSLK